MTLATLLEITPSSRYINIYTLNDEVKKNYPYEIKWHYAKYLDLQVKQVWGENDNELGVYLLTKENI